MSENKVDFVHLRRSTIEVSRFGIGCKYGDPKGGVTLAVAPVEGGLRVAVARCRNDELYCKATGRNVALVKMSQGDSVFIPTAHIPEGEAFFDVPILDEGEAKHMALVEFAMEHCSRNLRPVVQHNRSNRRQS